MLVNEWCVVVEEVLAMLVVLVLVVFILVGLVVVVLLVGSGCECSCYTAGAHSCCVAGVVI